MATDTRKTDAKTSESGHAEDATGARGSLQAGTERDRPGGGRLDPEQRRTAAFVLGAAACLALTLIIEWTNRPASIEDFGRVGQEFYPEFNDPTLATALEVYAFDPDEVRPRDFRVQRLDNGRWVIPSHHDYPADAEDQLAQTAASIIGIRRGAMMTRWPADHAQYGVVNPKQDTLSVGDVEGVGKRIVLRGDNDSVLADYIVGNKVEGESGQYYVRHPEEDEVYLATLDIDLSTKFTDWIETDLLNVDSWDMTEVTVNNYSFDDLQGRVAEREITTVRRERSNDPWTMVGLNDETKEVDEDAVRETVDTLADLEVVGIRPKQQGLTPELKLDRQALQSQRDVDQLQSDLLTRGFLLQPGENGDQENLRLIAREGEMYAATSEGLIYRLYFGRAFAGSQEELEIGFTSGGQGNESDEGQATGDPPDVSGDGARDDDAAPGASGGEVTAEKPGRYVFVRVEFDKKYLGEPPEEPVQPETPPELREPAGPAQDDAENQDLSEEVSSGDAPESDKQSGDEVPAGAPAEVPAEVPADAEDEEDRSDEAEDELAEIRSKYDEAQRDYEEALKEYERQSEEFEQRNEEGQKKADELNRRFAEWYYVIPGDSFDKLRLSRDDLVKEKEDDGEEEEEGPSIQDRGDRASDAGTDPVAANQAKAERFLTQNRSEEGVTTTESGLQYEVIEEGTGDSPSASSTVKVKYKGTLLDGTVFDESGDEAVEFRVDQVIPGWTEALQLMKSGAQWRLFIPPDLAYGERGFGDRIGPNALLIFDVELISFE